MAADSVIFSDDDGVMTQSVSQQIQKQFNAFDGIEEMRWQLSREYALLVCRDV